MYNLDNLNMKYISYNNNEEIEGGAILECLGSWSIEELTEWLPDYDLNMIELVQTWLNNTHCISEGLYLKVWVDLLR